MRKCLVVIVVLALVIGLVGCSGTSKGGSDASDSSGSSGSGSSSGGSKASSAKNQYAALKLETNAEKDALAVAESEEGRKWASGDFQNGAPVEGDASLVGYTFVINDGATTYQLRVMGGKLVPYIGMNGDMMISGPYDSGWYTPTPPESNRQTAAWEMALAEVAKTNPNAKQGGIESYVFLFPANENGDRPSVCVYSNRSEYTKFAMGGPWYE